METRASTSGPEAAAPMRGGCQCGACRYEVTGPPLDLYVCHCTECRRQSASAFGISVIVRAAELRLLAGTPRVWHRPGRAGRLACHFCPECGTRLFHIPEAEPEIVSVKGGSLDTPPDLSRAKHIWTRRRLPGIVIPPGVACYPGEPPR